MNKKFLLSVSAALLVGALIGIPCFRWFESKYVAVNPTNTKTITAPLANGSQTDSAAAGDNTGPDWCFEHRVPESECTQCHPQLIDAYEANADWCVEHSLPESHCRLCHPDLTFAQEPRVETPVDTSFKPTVFFPANKSSCATDHAIIQFATSETAQRAGLVVVPAIATTETAAAEAPAEVVFNETTAFAVTTSIPLSVIRWLVEPGKIVKAGQAFAEVESPEMPKLQSEYLEAHTENNLRVAEWRRADSLFRKNLISAAEFQQLAANAQVTATHLASAKGMLHAAGVSDEDIQKLTDAMTISPKWALRTQQAGTLLERKATLGEFLSAGSALALIGNPSSLWIEADVRENDLRLFEVGEMVEFSSDGDALDRVNARIIWVSQFVDPDSRTGTVRAEVITNDAKLQANSFGRISLLRTNSSSSVAIPRDAVQWEGCCNVVFVQESQTRYRPQKVNVARGDHGYYKVTAGLRLGELVVTKGSYLLKTELRKGSLGAGCCAVAPKS